MENINNDYLLLLEMISSPAFIVQGDVIIHCNRGARQMVINPGDEIAPLLGDNLKAFKEFEGGCLSVPLTLDVFTRPANITKLSDAYLFSVEEAYVPTELKAMSLLSDKLRVPVSGLLMYARQNKETMREDIYRELYRITRMINNIANARQYASDDGTFHQERDLCSVVEEILEECATLLSEADITLKYELPAKPIYTVCDNQMLRQAIYNMIDNAVHNCPADEPIEVTLSQCDRFARLTVADHGKGISNAVRSNFFNCYTRELNLEDGTTGLGLGMTVVRNAALAHGGTVLVNESEDGGTRVTMTLQLKSSGGKVLRTPTVTIIPPLEDGTVMLSDVLPTKLYKVD